MRCPCARALVTLLLVGVASAAFAQSLVAIVRDPVGAIVADGVELLLTNLDTGGTLTARPLAGPRGAFLIPLAPGRWRVTVNVAPYHPADETFRIRAGRSTTLVLWLHFRDVVTVQHTDETGDTPTAFGPHLTGDDLARGPQPYGPTVLSAICLAPTVVCTPQTGTQGQFSTNGARRLSNVVSVDGVRQQLHLNPTNAVGDGTGALHALTTIGDFSAIVSVEAIQDMAIQTSAASPADARGSGAHVAITTRAGGPRFRGLIFGQTQPDALAARDYFDPNRRTYRNGGLTVGGPVRGHVRYFGSIDHQFLDQSLATTVEVPSERMRTQASPVARAMLAAWPRAGAADTPSPMVAAPYTIPAVSQVTAVSARVDGLALRHQVFGRVHQGGSSGRGLAAAVRGPGAFTQTERTRTALATIGAAYVGPALTHEARVGITRNRVSTLSSPAAFGGAQLLPLDMLLPEGRSPDNSLLMVTLFEGPMGQIFQGPSARGTHHQAYASSTVSTTRGGHSWTFGGEYQRRIASSRPPEWVGRYRFNGIAQLLDGQVGQLTQTYLHPTRVRLQQVVGFVQDRVALGARASALMGLRYDLALSPGSLTDLDPTFYFADQLPLLVPRPMRTPLWRPTWRDLTPVVAFEYQGPFDWTLKAGWRALVDDPSGTVVSAHGRAEPYTFTSTTKLPAFPVPDAILSAAPTGLSDIVEQFAIAQRFRRPHGSTWHVSVEGPLAPAQRLALTYVGSRGTDLIYRWSSAITPRSVAFAVSNDARSTYHSVQAHYRAHWSAALRADVFYGWSQARDSDSGEGGTRPSPSASSLAFEWGPADFDRPHVLRASLTARSAMPFLPRWARLACDAWDVSVLFLGESGTPFSVTEPRQVGTSVYLMRPNLQPGVPLDIPDATSPTGRRLNGEAFRTPDTPRQGTLGRNQLRASGLRQVDLSLQRAFALSDRLVAHVRLDVANVFNEPMFAPADNQLNTIEFGAPTRTYAAALGTGRFAGGLTPLLQVGGARSIRLGLRLAF